MARQQVDLSLHWGEEIVSLVASSSRAEHIYHRLMDVPEDCKAIDVGGYSPEEVLSQFPPYFIFGTTKITPKKIHKYLFPA